MFIPIPALAVIGAIFILLLVLALRPSRGRDPMLGIQSSAYPPTPYRRPAGAPPSVPTGAYAPSLPPEIETQIAALMSAGRKIEAIKIVRDATGLGLKESKDLVEGLPRRAM